MSLIRQSPRTRDCGQKWTDSWSCNACVNTHLCTIKVSYVTDRVQSVDIFVQNPLTGVIKQIMKKPYRKAQHLGGTMPVLKLKSWSVLSFRLLYFRATG